MSSLLEAFDFIVIGDEPGAYWWIEKVLDYTKAVPQDGKRLYSAPKIAHVSFRKDTEAVLPLSIVPRFGINPKSFSPASSLECILPEKLLDWNRPTIEKSFGFQKCSALENAFQPMPTSADTSMLRYHLRQHPELLELSQGIWRVFGKADTLLPEGLLWNALQLSTYVFWKPSLSHKDAHVREYTSSQLPTKNWIRLDSQGKFELELVSGATLGAPDVIIAVNSSELDFLRNSCPDLAALLHAPKDSLSPTADYTLRINEVTPPLLKHLKPISVLYENSHLPMPQEIHTVRAYPSENALSIDFESKYDFSLDEIMDQASHAYDQVLKLIPDLETTHHIIGLPLSSRDCEIEEERDRALKLYETVRRPRFTGSVRDGRTLHPRIALWTPFLNCQWAYPFGQLEAARKHLAEYFGKKRFKKSTQSVEAPTFFG